MSSYAFLFPGDADTAAPDAFDPRFRLACELYNRALTEEEINQDMENGVFFAVTPKDKLATTWGKLKMSF